MLFVNKKPAFIQEQQSIGNLQHTVMGAGGRASLEKQGREKLFYLRMEKGNWDAVTYKEIPLLCFVRT